MYVVCVTVFVSPEGVDAFVEATRDNHVNTRQEPGNLRFDVLRAEDDPTRFFSLRGLPLEGGVRLSPADAVLPPLAGGRRAADGAAAPGSPTPKHHPWRKWVVIPGARFRS